jgi:WD40 repeat protein
VLFNTENEPIRLPAFSSDGSRFAFVVGTTNICVWDVSHGTVLESRQHSGSILSFALSPDGAQVISICRSEKERSGTTVYIWRVLEGSSFVTLNSFTDIRSAVFLPDAIQFVTLSGSGGLQTWDTTQDPPVLRTTSSMSGYEQIKAVSPDGTKLLAYTPNRDIPLLLYDFSDAKERAILGSSCNGIGMAIFSPNSHRLAFNTWVGVTIVDALTGALKYFSNENLHLLLYAPLFFYPDSNQLVRLSANGDLQMVDTQLFNTWSCYPSERMMVRYSHETNGLLGRWFFGEDKIRLFWVPDSMKGIWLASSLQFGCSYVVVARTDHDVITLDMADYLNALPASAAWRRGGIKYTADMAEIAKEYAFVGKSLLHTLSSRSLLS